MIGARSDDYFHNRKDSSAEDRPYLVPDKAPRVTLPPLSFTLEWLTSQELGLETHAVLSALSSIPNMCW